jgi:hypothetical protein
MKGFLEINYTNEIYSFSKNLYLTYPINSLFSLIQSFSFPFLTKEQSKYHPKKERPRRFQYRLKTYLHNHITVDIYTLTEPNKNIFNGTTIFSIRLYGKNLSSNTKNSRNS